MKTTARKTPAKARKGAARRPAAKTATKTTKAGERADGLRPGSKMAIMLDLAARPQGATEAEICQKLGWKKCRVTLRRTAEKVGATIETSKDPEGATVYKVSVPKKKAA